MYALKLKRQYHVRVEIKAHHREINKKQQVIFKNLLLLLF